MDRRIFLKTSSMAAGASLVPPSFAGASSAPASGGARSLRMNRGWKFSPKVTEGDHLPGFDDSGFATVVVPHTNKMLPWHSFDDKEYEFISCYRRHFRLPPGSEGKRVYVDFDGAMVASTVWINGHALGEYKGGYTPFSFELTPHLNWSGDNLLALHLDSTERNDIPPFGFEVDYMTFGGIYRDVHLRVVPAVSLENVFARGVDVLSGHPALEVECYFNGEADAKRHALLVKCYDGEKLIAKAEAAAVAGAKSQVVSLTNVGPVELWDLKHPKLYSVSVELLENRKPIDEMGRRFGFREAKFTPSGFMLNGKVLKLRGLDRHQTFPYVGQAMPDRVQRKDAQILKQELKCNIVRTSHYPQSPAFLDACDELGLLVLEEIPGWQHIGDAAWKDIAVDNVGRMIRRDWNHPSIILWGVRINESKDDHEFYTRTNALAHSLDKTRQTGGIRSNLASELLEDVYTNNDFGFPLHAPVAPRYLNTEFVGHTFPTRSTDNSQRLREHTLRHARIHDQIASDAQFSGGLGWCAFDYNTHNNFGSGDRICYHGVSDIFRLPKPAAGFYKSQCDPEDEIVLEIAQHWANNDEDTGFTDLVVCSNCDHLKLFLEGAEGFQPLAEADPDRKQFPHLKYAPFTVTLGRLVSRHWGSVRIDGYLGGKKVITRTYSGRGVDRAFTCVADDTELLADGADTTRVVVRVTDEFGNIRPIASDAITFRLTGPGTLIGDNPFSLIGGAGAVWVRAQEQAGPITLEATHPRFGTKTVVIRTSAVPQESV